MVVYDILWKRGQTKEGKTQWERIGILIEKDDGKMSVKLDTIPVSSAWDGWLVVSERRDREPF